MYSTCIFCHAHLGLNEIIEGFPVGTRLAFDPARGRLWVVCRVCERWNLSPLEERWEAIEQCERRYRGTRMRVSTGNVGLCRLPEGLELVRIGEPMRPEFAAWRYGDQFGRRRRRAVATGLAWGVAGAAVVAGGVASGIGVAVAIQLPRVLDFVRSAVNRERIIARIPLEGHYPLTVRGKHLSGVELLGDGDGVWTLKVAHDEGDTRLHDEPALRAAGLILPRVNSAGASAAQIRDALRLLDSAGDPAHYFRMMARRLPGTRRVMFGEDFYGGRSHYGALGRLAPAQRLALEMAAHETQERRALQGELAELREAWRVAEEIAAIADGLLVPAGVEQMLGQLHAASEGEK